MEQLIGIIAIAVQRGNAFAIMEGAKSIINKGVDY
jgi:hypothetical protein